MIILIYSTDVGSLKFDGDFRKFEKGVRIAQERVFSPSTDYDESLEYFEKSVYEGFMLKKIAGIDIACYPQYMPMDFQFRVLWKMFYDFCRNIPPTDFLIEDPKHNTIFNPKYTQIAEISALKKYSEKICKEVGERPIKIKDCITAPELLLIPDELLPTLVDFYVSLVRNSLKDSDNDNIVPVIVTLDSPNIEHIVGRSDKKSSKSDMASYYEAFFRGVKSLSKDLEVGIHAHTEFQSAILKFPLDIIDIHSSQIDSTSLSRKDLENNGKRLQVGVTNTDNVDVVEHYELMRDRLKKAVFKFGYENIAYAAPDCGLRSWTLENAFACLQNVARAVDEINQAQMK